MREPQKVENGRVRPTETPGTGLRFEEFALAPTTPGSAARTVIENDRKIVSAVWGLGVPPAADKKGYS